MYSYRHSYSKTKYVQVCCPDTTAKGTGTQLLPRAPRVHQLPILCAISSSTITNNQQTVTCCRLFRAWWAVIEIKNTPVVTPKVCIDIDINGNRWRLKRYHQVPLTRLYPFMTFKQQVSPSSCNNPISCHTIVIFPWMGGLGKLFPLLGPLPWYSYKH